jgi:thiamine biosynthesis protein ThiS
VSGSAAASTIVLNGSERPLEKPVTVGALVLELGLPRERVAVELNGSIVRKADYDATLVEPGARVEVVSFVGGG